MADALSTWTRLENPDTHEVEFCTEASSLHMKPGDTPGSRSLPEGRFALAHHWTAITSEGDLIGWTVTMSNGTTYTIFND